jgi:acetyl-CoA carboxylase carboxyl transferase subunit alpha
MEYILEFEKPVIELEKKIQELKQSSDDIDLESELTALKEKAAKLWNDIHTKLTPWEIVQIARHPLRPHGAEYIKALVEDFHELHGDRKFADDKSVVCGFGYFNGQKVAAIAIEKGRKTSDKIKHNFGMMNPEGYRKSVRIMKLAEQFNLPIITFVDTPGAYPGLGAEERGQSEAIADSLVEMVGLKTPIISVVIGEGGSGGALGLAIADQVHMLGFSVYSVISPESCASILWADPRMAETAANALQLTSSKSLELGIIDSVIEEPVGGAHRHPEKCFKSIKEMLIKELEVLKAKSIDELMNQRYEKFRKIGNQTLNWGEES